ncbi:PAS domain-containing protein, partial [Acinetobacter baumannii]
DTFQLSFESLFKSIHPDDATMFRQHQKNAFEHDLELDIEHRIILPDGSVKWIHEKGGWIKDDKGKKIYFGGVVQDIT